jgi:putative acetyltransferase
MSTNITSERPDTADALLLIAELEAYLDPLYPPASRHGLSVERLLAEAVAFFVLRYNGTAAGCAGIKLVGSAYGEVKRMYVRPQFRRFGLGKLLLNHLASHARNHGVGCLRLETGIFQTEAIALYERVGFRRIPPFGNYPEDPLSLFYEKLIEGDTTHEECPPTTSGQASPTQDTPAAILPTTAGRCLD